MRKNLTYIVFVVDRSGSMSSIKSGMIEGFNAFIKEQRKTKGDCKVFFYQFDTEYNAIYEGINLDSVKNLDDKTYKPRGNTALYPSLGKTIEDIGKKLAVLDESERPERVLFVTITDGYDNSALYEIEGKRITEHFHQFTSAQVKNMINHQEEVYNWDFAYIGANQDAWAVGSAMGCSNNLNYVATAAGTNTMWNKLSDSATKYRSASVKSKFAFEPEDNSNSLNAV